MNPIRFYNLYEGYYDTGGVFHNASQEQATNFECVNDFVELDGLNWHATYCVRGYKKFRDLYDVHFALASVDFKAKGVMAEFVALGMAPENINRLVGRFMEAVSWNR
jgi:5'-3' exonuclease